MYERFGLELREIIIRVNRLGVDLIMWLLTGRLCPHGPRFLHFSHDYHTIH
jgi:hypothetical protein